MLSLQREPYLTLISLPTNKDACDHITCSSFDLVYMIQCNKCNVHYIGDTKCYLSERFGEHRCAIEKAIAQQHTDQPTAVSDHFTLPAHSMDNKLVALELITSNRDAICKARGAFLISKGKTLNSLY